MLGSSQQTINIQTPGQLELRSSITYGNQLLIKEQLEANSTVPEITEAEMKAKLFYQSCIDKNETIEKLGATPLTNILNKFMSLNNDSKLVVNETFENLLTYVQVQFGLNALLEMNVNDDDKNSSYSDIQVNFKPTEISSEALHLIISLISRCFKERWDLKDPFTSTTPRKRTKK